MTLWYYGKMVQIDISCHFTRIILNLNHSNLDSRIILNLESRIYELESKNLGEQIRDFKEYSLLDFRQRKPSNCKSLLGDLFRIYSDSEFRI